MSPRRPGIGQLFSSARDARTHPLRVWPYTWRSLGWFAAAFVAMTAVWTLAGLAVVEWFEPTDLGRAEVDLSTWAEEQRTETLTTVAEALSFPSDTPVKIALMAVGLIAFPLIWRRWHEWAFLLGALLLEVSVYGASSTLVGRPRPPVEQLTSVPTKSFPSGHVAAAVTFYLGLVIVVSWNTTSKVWRGLAWGLGAVIPIGVFASRLYLGMHYVSDMIAGALLGLASLAVALHIAREGLETTVTDSDDPVPEHTADLDLVEA